MFDRAKIVDENFIKRVSAENFPAAALTKYSISREPSESKLIEMFESQVLSRQLDIIARELKNQGESFYTIGSSGHEGNAAIGEVFKLTDMAFLHYRSGAFMIQRAKKRPQKTILYDLMLSLVASSEDPAAGGRHKVWGSLGLGIPPQTSTISSHLPKAVGMAYSIPRVKYVPGLKNRSAKNGLVLCSFGDASLNHATAQGALNAASWCSYQNLPLPMIFICEDNRLGISVRTPEGWVEDNLQNRPGLKYFSCDGLNVIHVYETAKKVEQYVRANRRPAVLHLKMVRMLGHAGSDIESTYQTPEKIATTESQDPLLHTARLIRERNYLTKEQIIDLYNEMHERVVRVSVEAMNRPKLKNVKEVMDPIASNKILRTSPPIPQENNQVKVSAVKRNQQEKVLKERPQPMSKLINWTLDDLMERYSEIVMFGEDVARKGGVYHITAGLFKKYGEKRIFNTLLDEQTILGLGIGMAHNGFLPIPEIQFLAYYHNAEDQIRGEASSLSFFSNNKFHNPMVVRIPGLPYQKGFGGHFHNDNSLTVFRDVPGILVCCPSNGLDASKMLRTCVKEAYEKGRVVIFIEPISLYMTRDLHQKGDEKWCFHYPKQTEEIPYGKLGTYGDKRTAKLTIVTYGNGTYLSLQAQKKLLEEHKIKVRVVDVRWLVPLPEKAIIKELKECKNVLIVDECRREGSVAEGLVTSLVENLHPLPKMSVLAAENTFISLGPAANMSLPSTESIVEKVRKILKK